MPKNPPRLATGSGTVISLTATGAADFLAAATSHGLGEYASVRGVYRGVRLVAFVLTERIERFDVMVSRRSLKGSDGWMAVMTSAKGPPRASIRIAATPTAHGRKWPPANPAEPLAAPSRDRADRALDGSRVRCPSPKASQQTAKVNRELRLLVASWVAFRPESTCLGVDLRSVYERFEEKLLAELLLSVEESRGVVATVLNGLLPNLELALERRSSRDRPDPWYEA